MKTISVPLQRQSYPIWIDIGLIDKIPRLLGPINQDQKWILISQDKIFDLYGKSIIDNMINQNYNVKTILLPDGEVAKSLNELEKIYKKLILYECDRDSTLIALGGGVVGDVTGFIASTYMRGINYIQIPTSLLAMVDSSIGGKTGINLNEGKNLVGSIWQPKAVIIDPELIQSLPDREIISAIGEIIKYGAILDRSLFDKILLNIDDLIKLKNNSQILDIIASCAKLKADIVAQDECEKNIRQILNFGHTIGHALENYFGFDILRHGEAVAYGMLVAAKLSINYSNFDNREYIILKNIIEKLPLPTLPKFSSEEIINIIKKDKKNKFGKINFVLLKNIGSTAIKNNISENSIKEALETL